MDAVFSFLSNYWWVGLMVVLAVGYKFVFYLLGIVIIPEDKVGIVTKKFAIFGTDKTLPDGCLVALKGEAGIQADTLAPGIHFGYWPWQYVVEKSEFTTIDRNKIGVVESRDGKSLSGGRVLAKQVECDSFQDARSFLTKGGERGPQIAIMPPGTYRVNTALFSVERESVLDIPDNRVGIVTTKDGKPLEIGEIAGKAIDKHNMYQDAQSFIDEGGFKGLQEQVILAGRYYINPRFATVEIVPMTEVPIANAGVVIAYVGDKGEDVTGESFKHGNLVAKGKRGVWIEPLDPGKYPINPYTHKVECVPTANVVLNWATGKTESHKLDESLCTITVRSSDGFKFNLDVSQIIHVPRNDAPIVIARFGTMLNLITQVLEPTIGNYFRNAAQGSDVISFLKERSVRQEEAKTAINAALRDYNINAVDTLIGDINPPDSLMKTLTDRKLAEEEKITFDTQRMAEDTRKELQQAKAMADTQAKVVDAERSVSIAEFNAQSAVKTAEGNAQSKTINAQADAGVITMVGNAEAEKTKAIGTAEADVIKMKIASMESSNYAAVQIAEALASNGIKLVPDILVTGGGANGGGTLVDVLLANVIRDSLGKEKEKDNEPKNPKQQAIS